MPSVLLGTASETEREWVSWSYAPFQRLKVQSTGQ